MNTAPDFQGSPSAIVRRAVGLAKARSDSWTPLKPRFDAIPTELRALPRWVTHIRKVPYDPTSPRGKASVADPATWGSFQQAEASYFEGGRDGVGFVLNADGVVGVDVDHAVVDGSPDPAAVSLMRQIGCQYIELSPSGTGLRGWGYGEDIGCAKGVIGGIHIELYSRGRFLTCTGHVLESGPLVRLEGFADVARRLRAERRPTPQKTAEEPRRTTDFHLPLSSVGCRATTPEDMGQRNACLFQLARRAKAQWPNATLEQRRALVMDWHARHVDVVGTKPFTVSFDDFERGWKLVRYGFGDELAEALRGADLSAPLPEPLRTFGYGMPEQRLWNLCQALQRHAGDEPFFLSARMAAELLGYSDHKDSAAMLRVFVGDGVLVLVNKGTISTASRYRIPQEPRANVNVG